MDKKFDTPSRGVGDIDDHPAENRPQAPSTSHYASLSLKKNERLVYEALLRATHPVKAYDLLEALRDRGLRAPMTIYRALDALETKGVVRKISGLNAYVARNFDEMGCSSAFLICRDCLQAKEVKLNPTEVANLFSYSLVDVDDIQIEVFTTCQNVRGGRCDTVQ
ncbi:MAG: hypothetical protein AAF224_10505 [Pseudomonadota bacterium]